MNAAPIRVLIADDQALVRSGLALVIGTEPGMQVAGEAADGRQALARCHQLQPDIALLDIRMPDLDGLEVARRLIHAQPAIRTAMLTAEPASRQGPTERSDPRSRRLGRSGASPGASDLPQASARCRSGATRSRMSALAIASGFATAYVREAHPSDRYPQPEAFDRKLEFAREAHAARRASVAGGRRRRRRRAASPPRSEANGRYVIDTGGRVAFRALWSNDREEVLADAPNDLIAGRCDGGCRGGVGSGLA